MIVRQLLIELSIYLSVLYKGLRLWSFLNKRVEAAARLGYHGNVPA